MSDSMQPHRQQPTRLRHPWDSPGKNTGVGCHFLLQCMKVKSESEITQLCLTLRNPMDCSLPGSSIHGIFQARVLEWVAIAFSEYSGLISFRIGWLDLLAIQGTLKSLLQHYSSKASILWCSAFFIVQVSHPYMTTGKSVNVLVNLKKQQQQKKNSVNFTLPLWSLHSLCEDALNEQCWIEEMDYVVQMTKALRIWRGL